MNHIMDGTPNNNAGIRKSGEDGMTIKDTDIRNFGTDVIEASQTKPVIVDFWADWCGPCKQLMPALEASVRNAGGAVSLVKVNADQNQTLCAQMQVQSLPTVLAFWQGQPVDGFQGALPQSQIDQFVARLSDLAGTGANDGLAAALEEAERLLESGENENAQALYHQIISTTSADSEHKSYMTALIGFCTASAVLGQLEPVREIMDGLDRNEIKEKDLLLKLDKIQATLDLADLGSPADNEAALTEKIENDPMDHSARLALAKSRIAAGDMAAGADNLLGIIMRERDWQDGEANTLLLKLFEAAGPTDAFTLKYRRRLSSILFS